MLLMNGLSYGPALTRNTKERASVCQSDQVGLRPPRVTSHPILTRTIFSSACLLFRTVVPNIIVPWIFLLNVDQLHFYVMLTGLFVAMSIISRSRSGVHFLTHRLRFRSTSQRIKNNITTTYIIIIDRSLSSAPLGHAVATFIKLLACATKFLFTTLDYERNY